MKKEEIVNETIFKLPGENYRHHPRWGEKPPHGEK